MEKSLRDLTLHELLSAYSAPGVAPAGISGSALGGAVGAALIVKVGRISQRRLEPGPERDRLSRLADKVENLRNMLEDIVEQDATAYARVVRLKSPSRSGENGADLERALKTATIIPGAMGRAALICVNSAAEMVEMAYPPVLPDLGMGAWLCFAAAETSLLTVKHNLTQIADEAFAKKILSRLDFFDDRAATLGRILDTIGRRTV